MEERKPSYYDEFKCQASECSFTCCGQWHITVDQKTKNKWKKFPIPEACRIPGMLFSKVKYESQLGDILKLNEDGSCPFLNEDKLCNLVIAYGEDMLCDTCHVFPREKHSGTDYIERSLNVGCPEVLNLLWEKEKFDADKAICDQDIYISIRDWFISIMNDSDKNPELILKMIFFLALDLEHMEEGETLSTNTFEKYRTGVDFDELANAINGFRVQEEEKFLEGNEIFLDLIENYRKKGIYREKLDLMARTAERLEESYEEFRMDQMVFNETFKEYQPKIRTLLAEEIFSECYSPGGNLRSMLLKLEWLALEYVALRQAVFLLSESNQMVAHALPYEKFRDLTSLMFRITGFSDEDIEDYLEDCFENPIWDFGYFNFII